MTPTTKNATPTVNEDTELSFGAMLVAEAEDGSYEPVNMVSTIREAREMGVDNFQSRMRQLAADKGPMCPDGYVVWARSFDGYRIVTTIDPR